MTTGFETGAYFALAGVFGSVLFYPMVVLLFLGFVPALLLVPLGFMIAGGVVSAKIDLKPEIIRSLAWAFALVGIGVVGSQIGAQSIESGTAIVRSGGSMFAGFVAAGLAAAGGAGAGVRARAFLALTCGGVVGASALVVARLLVEVSGPLSVTVGAVTGLGVAGALAAGSGVWSRTEVLA